MRVPAILSAAAVLLAACGGAKSGETAPAGGAATSAVNATATTTGATITVEMIESKYVPAEITIKPGDVVVFKNVSGGPHNVQFYPDSIPPGANTAIDAGIADKMAPLASSLSNVGESITISFKDAPVGTYKYFCAPHLSAAMKGTITIAQ